ncbi:hypothetical protein WJU23_10230 [Prosthecobacter sp. SYSU 5D2]|uniref:beta strand repeat-containing protein n=1 Tax=Prosthecobacter sp. SYSU 5D2 TaxID=3134134 RepID=UPI0031FE4D0C
MCSGLIEYLEPRLAPAGIITLTVAGGVLTITGDGADNGIRITDDPLNGEWDITDPLAGTSYVLNGVVQAAPFSIPAQLGIKANLGDGNDDIRLIGSGAENAFILSKGIKIVTGAGNDNIDIGTGGTQNFIIGGAFQVNMGDGDDEFDFNASSTILSAVKILAGTGDDNVDFEGGGTLVLTKGLNVDLGTGNDDLDIIATSFSVTGGALTIKAAGGAGTTPSLTIGSSQFSAAGAVNITVLAGNSSIEIGNTSTDVLNFGSGLKVIGGTGNDTVDFNGQMLNSAAVLVDLKAGNNSLIMENNGSMSGTTLTFKGLTGNDELRMDPNYALQLAGQFNLNLGAGDNTFGALAGSTLAAGSLVYKGGAGVDGIAFDGASLRTNGVSSFLLGDGANILDLAPTASLFVGGSLGVTSLNGNDILTVNTPSFNVLGSLNLKLGSGNNATTFTGATARIGGAVNYTGGIGTDTFESTNTEFFVQRAVNFNGGAGVNTLYLRPTDGIIGSLKYTGGTGDDFIALGDTGGASDLVAINGAMLANLGSGSSLLYLTDTLVQGNVTTKSTSKSVETDQFIANNSSFNGHLNAIHGAGTSVGAFIDVVVRGNFLLNAGEGSSSILLDHTPGSPVLSQWFGTVKIITGSGDDSVVLGSNPVVPNAGNIFYKDISVNLGAGTNSFTQGNNTFLAGTSFP